MSGLAVDVKEFQSALKQYASLSRKSLPAILNGKAKDLLIKAGKNTPITNKTVGEFNREVRSNKPLATARANKKHGRGKWGRAEWDIEWARLQSQRLGKGFMRSGYYKAAAKFRTVDPARNGAQSTPSILASDSPSNATIKAATESILSAVADVSWKAKEGGDKAEKERIVDGGMRRALPIVTADMVKYINRKLEKEAKKVSATIAKSVPRLFT